MAMISTFILYVISEFMMAFSSYPSEPSFLFFSPWAYALPPTTKCWSCPVCHHWPSSLVILCTLSGKPHDSNNFNSQIMPTKTHHQFPPLSWAPENTLQIIKPYPNQTVPLPRPAVSLFYLLEFPSTQLTKPEIWESFLITSSPSSSHI